MDDVNVEWGTFWWGTLTLHVEFDVDEDFEEELKDACSQALFGSHDVRLEY